MFFVMPTVAVLLALGSDRQRQRRRVEEQEALYDAVIGETEFGAGLMPAATALDSAFYFLDNADLDIEGDGWEERYEELMEGALSSLGVSAEDPVLYVGTLEIPREARRQGYGRDLMEGAERWATAHGAKLVVVYSTDIGAGHSEGFMRRLGYEMIFEAPWGGGVMVKHVEPAQ